MPTYHKLVGPGKNGNNRTVSYTFYKSRAVYYPRLTYGCVRARRLFLRTAFPLVCLYAAIAHNDDLYVRQKSCSTRFFRVLVLPRLLVDGSFAVAASVRLYLLDGYEKTLLFAAL